MLSLPQLKALALFALWIAFCSLAGGILNRAEARRQAALRNQQIGDL